MAGSGRTDVVARRLRTLAAPAAFYPAGSRLATSATGLGVARTGPRPSVVAKPVSTVPLAMQGIVAPPLMDSTRGGLTALRVRIALSRDVPQPGHPVVKLSLEAFLHDAMFLCGVSRR